MTNKSKITMIKFRTKSIGCESWKAGKLEGWEARKLGCCKAGCRSQHPSIIAFKPPSNIYRFIL
jgi:hypothetical protein